MNVDAVTLELGMILVSGLASIFVLVLSLYRSLGVKSRVALAVVGDLLFSANLLLQQYHTYRDLERDNITCILDTQGTIVACTLVLAGACHGVELRVHLPRASGYGGLTELNVRLASMLKRGAQRLLGCRHRRHPILSCLDAVMCAALGARCRFRRNRRMRFPRQSVLHNSGIG